MAFPVAHSAVGLTIAKLLGRPVEQNWRWALATCILAVAPDLDFLAVWLFGLERSSYHRTWTHSLVVALLGGLVLALLRRRGERWGNFVVLTAVIASHGLLDATMVDDRSDHGVPLIWPFSGERFGWRSPLVPLYQYFYPSAQNIWKATLPYTLLETVLATPVWVWLVWSRKRNRQSPAGRRQH